MVCNAKGYTFDWGAYSPSSPSSSLSSSSGSGSSGRDPRSGKAALRPAQAICARRSEEHTSELEFPMRISYAVFCLKKKNKITNVKSYHNITLTDNQTNI